MSLIGDLILIPITDGLGSGAILQPAQGEPTMTETYTETTVAVLKNGNVNMTVEQWDGWSETVNDDEYQLDSISANLGLTRA